MIIADSYIGSNDFWNTAITVVVALAVGWLAAWATLRSVNPRRRLIWRESFNGTLLRASATGTAISVTSGSTVLDEPRLIEIHLKNIGSRDIQASDFVCGDDSLIFDCGASIIDVVGIQTVPTTAVAPSWMHIGNDLHVKPSFMPKGQSTSFTILVDGPHVDARLKTAQILETPVGTGEIPDFKPKETIKQKLQLWAAIGGIALVVMGTPACYIFMHGEVVNDNYRLRQCRYWDVHDRERAKKDCPEPTKPLPPGIPRYR